MKKKRVLKKKRLLIVKGKVLYTKKNIKTFYEF
jgi:hypothetical protein